MSSSNVQWRQIQGYEGRYDVSNHGQVRLFAAVSPGSMSARWSHQKERLDLGDRYYLLLDDYPLLGSTAEQLGVRF